MNHKVLLADDSLTIQKVIKITLASQPYDITDCSTEDELFAKLPVLLPKIVFLDFNLSEKHTGYDLTAKIKSLSPNTKVLLLLGTFDTVDDGAMEKCGASDKIVKPFDSNKFIAICRQMIDSFPDSDPTPVAAPAKAEGKPVVVAPPVAQAAPEDQWTVSHTTEVTEPVIEIKTLDSSFPTDLNPLTQEIHSWGMTVPGVINENTSADLIVELPPVIGATPAAKAEVKAVPKLDDPKTLEIKFPEVSDLDYPTMEDLTSSNFQKPAQDTSSNVFNLNNNAGFELELEGNYVEASSGDVKSIEAQIHDEVADNLWQVDEFEDLKREVSSKIEEVKSTFQPTINDFDESLFKPIDESETIQWQETDHLTKTETPAAQVSSPSMDDIRAHVDELVKKHVKEYLDQMFQKSVEKVSWEVIPDLAENLIRQELSRISHKILGEQN